MANRRSWGAPVCLSTETKPGVFNMSNTMEGGMTGVVPPGQDTGKWSVFPIQCFPLYSLLLAVGNPTVNLLSLDIEGAEFEVSYFWCNRTCGVFNNLF